MTDRATVIIDAQVGFFEGDPAVYQAAGMMARIKGLVERARAAGVPVIFVQDETDLAVDGPIHPDLSPAGSEPIVSKLTPDAFHETTLKEELAKLGASKLIIAGFQTELCIDTTIRRAWSMGYAVTLAADAHSTFDFYDAPLTAKQTIAHHNDVLTHFATVTLSADIEF